VGIGCLGGLDDGKFQITEALIIIGDEGEVARDVLWHSSIGKALGDTLAVGCIGDVLADLRPVRLARGLLAVRSECSACAHPGPAASEEIPRGPQRSGIDRRLREHTTPEQRGTLVRIDLVVCGFAAVNRPHLEGVPQHEGYTFVHTEIGEPIPGEETFDGDDQPLPLGSHGLEKGFRGRFHVAVHQEFPLATPEADRHGAGMQVDPTVKLVRRGVEAQAVSSAVVSERCSQPQQSLGGMLRGRPQSLSPHCSGRPTA
jgi:hypothetical protein